MHDDSSDQLSKNYDLIIETDFMKEMRFNLDFKNKIIKWNDAQL